METSTSDDKAAPNKTQRLATTFKTSYFKEYNWY